MTRDLADAEPTAGTRPAPGSAIPLAARLGVALAALLVGVAVLWAYWLRRDGVDLHQSGGQPLTGRLAWRLPLAALGPALVGAMAVALWPVAARRLRWPALVVGSTALAAAWAVLLAAVDGTSALGSPLATPFEYLRDVGRVGDVGAFLQSFTAHVPEGSADFHWTTHVGGHPPGALLTFVGLDRLGLQGPGWAAALCIAAGASAVAAVLITTRALAGEAVARRAAVFVALSPLALWVATSADALFCGVAAWGVCLLALAAGRTDRRGDALALAGGVVLGAALFLSYGMALMALIAVGVVVVQRRVRPLLLGAAAVAAVVLAFAAMGFWWLDGLAAAAARVREGGAWQDRPTTYFLLANLAALAIAVGPATIAGIGVLAGRARAWLTGPLRAAVVLPLTALGAVVIALASNLSKGEVERIYLPFAVWMLIAAAALPRRGQRGWLAAQVAVGLLVQLGWRLRW